MNRRTRDEYGGFLPLELNPGKERFENYEGKLRRFNCVKAAIVYAIQLSGITEIYIPYYYCPSTTEAIKNTGINVVFYHIDALMHPVNLQDKSDSAVVLVNYFGLLDEYIIQKSKEIRKANIFIDNAHAFFCRPVINDRTYNFYSAKKFIGVPDGAYLIGGNVQADTEKIEYASEYSHYLIKAYEKGTNAAYQEKKEADRYIGYHYTDMSRLARGLLKNADYGRIEKIRTENCEILRKAFLSQNRLWIRKTSPVYLFPLLIDGGRKIKNILISQKIFVPTLWGGEELMRNGNEFELRMSYDAVFLPVDQRYNPKDMSFMIGVVEELYNENTNT